MLCCLLLWSITYSVSWFYLLMKKLVKISCPFLFGKGSIMAKVFTMCSLLTLLKCMSVFSLFLLDGLVEFTVLRIAKGLSLKVLHLFNSGWYEMRLFWIGRDLLWSSGRCERVAFKTVIAFNYVKKGIRRDNWWNRVTVIILWRKNIV